MLRDLLIQLTEPIVSIIDIFALIIIAIGTVDAFINGTRVMFSHPEGHHAVRHVWMRYSRWLVAGLTFQLAADILETSVTPAWDDIGRIAAIAVVRTFLNFFLERDQRDIGELQRSSNLDVTSRALSPKSWCLFFQSKYRSYRRAGEAAPPFRKDQRRHSCAFAFRYRHHHP